MERHLKRKLRWNGQAWAPLAEVRELKNHKSPEQLARECTDVILENGLTDIVMIGERAGKDGVGKCYRWMTGSKLLWYSKQLEFYALHGRYAHDGANGGPI